MTWAVPTRRRFAALAAAGLTACVGVTSLARAQPGPLRTVTVASGLSHPWSLAFLPDGRMLVTERDGRLRVVSAAGALSPPVAGLPRVDAQGQGGLFDVLPAADFAQSRRIFLSYAEPGTGVEAGRNGTSVGSGVLSPDLATLTQWQVLFRQTPKVASAGHFGGRLVLAGNRLFVTLG
ncbi:MAG: PQQ-dependent sugar dehydrogenase, partial [Bryobacterales bacterium]|nr:PQQ-dependent sugar dehydrogenase [Bryobacterales bacterium]